MALHSSDDYFHHPYFQARRKISATLHDLFAKRVQEIKAITGALSGQRLLDIGCDTGSFVHHVQSEAGAIGTGIDVYARVVEQGRAAGLDLRHGTLEDMRFANGSFDVICAYDLLEHVAEPITFLREVRRVLRPDGLFVLETPNFDGLIYRIGRSLAAVPSLEGALRPLQERLWPAFHVQYFTAHSLRDALAGAGFAVRRLEGRELRRTELAMRSPVLRGAVVGIFGAARLVRAPTVLVATATAYACHPTIAA